MRKLGWLLLAFAPLIASVAGAAPLMDAAGRGVDVPAPPVHLLPAGPPAQVLLYALAPEHMLGLVEGWSAAQKSAVPDAYKGLPNVPRLTGHPSDADIAAIKALHPDFILDFGDVNPELHQAGGQLSGARSARLTPCSTTRSTRRPPRSERSAG